MPDAVQKLLSHNHQLAAIREYTLEQFVTFLDAAERADAVARVATVTDLATVIGGVFGGGKSLSNHIDSLLEVSQGE